MAFPQLRDEIEDVSIAIPDGKYKPAVIPTMKSPKRIVHIPAQKAVPIKAKPRAVFENSMVRL
jgi:hypothetical protein